MLQFYFLNPFDIPRRKFRKMILNHAGVCEITTLKSLGTRIEYDASRYVQGGSNMTGTNCDLFTQKSSRSYLNHLVTFETDLIFRLCYINI
jgi:hypothetical protein